MLCVVFDERRLASTKVSFDSIIKRLIEHGLQADLGSETDGQYVFVSLPEKALLEEAERLHLSKRLVDKGKPENKEHNFVGLFDSFKMDSLSQFAYSSSSAVDIFTDAERVVCTKSRLDSVSAGEGLSAHLRKALPKRGGSITSDMHTPILDLLMRCDIVSNVLVLPNHELSSQILTSCLQSIWTDPTTLIRDYYGDKVALYFAWMQYFTQWLIPIGVLGFFLWWLRPEGVTVDDAPFLPLYGLFVILWSHLFLKFWKRRSSEIACLWGTSPELRDPEYSFDERPAYRGDSVRISPITGRII